MSNNSLFEWLVQYHTERNLKVSRNFIEDGQFYINDLPVREGDENPFAFGCLILANGDTLVDRLKKENITLDTRDPEFVSAQQYRPFMTYLDQCGKKDGAFIYDGKNQKIARTSRLRNSSPSIGAVRKRRRGLVPEDFIFEDAQELTEDDLENHIGTKTDLAMVLPVAYTENGSNVHAYQIKRTAYTHLGLGKVTHFGSQGLMEEFFFKYNPASAGPFVDEEKKIVGVYRKYGLRNGQVKRVPEEPISYKKVA
ncbi:hypothetical protein HYX14_03380 [Candidatus Woesearchaeota archaeon]|nr:hypothetical protein [Candidatus Woesearchaeota archaeon]